jgi:death-on-curing protein
MAWFKSEAKIRDFGLIASAAARPQSGGFGVEAYPDDFQKAGALLHSVASNHGFVDGNKRTAWQCAVVFLDINGYQQIDPPAEDDIIELTLAASQSLINVDEIAAMLRQHFW